jgi:ADP-heptose:LPS heptosyltransferase
VTDDQHEVQRALGLVRAAGAQLPSDDWGLLSLRHPLPPVPSGTPAPPYVVLHPGTSVPARGWFPDRWARVAERLSAMGTTVVVTGGPDERDLTRQVAGSVALDLGGRTSWGELAAVLERACVVVVGNTGPAHLSAAVGTPVVSLFAPTVPARRWRPYGVPCELLGDQDAPCRDTRALHCPLPGHPCLGSVTPECVVQAVERASGTVLANRDDTTLQEVSP